MNASRSRASQIMSKVPEVTIFFWLIKVLCTTVGETFSDFLSVNLGLGLPLTTLLMGLAFVVVLYAQFRASGYVPILYWLTVVLISVFGTLVTDNLTDGAGVPLERSVVVFSALLALTFLIWYVSERTLSIHSIHSVRREAFYWLTILFTFALGTAVGDLYSEQLGLGYLRTGIAVLVVIACIFACWKFIRLNAILAFWTAYILTRPLGASLGDYLSQSTANGGLGLGATITSILFLIAIVAIIVFLIFSKIDRTTRDESPGAQLRTGAGSGRLQTAAVVIVFLAVGIGGYQYCSSRFVPAVEASQTTLAGQLGDFVQLEQSMSNDVGTGDFASVRTGADKLEHDWDQAEPKLRKIDRKTWTRIDGTIDSVLAAARAKHPDAAKCRSALDDSLQVLNEANQ